MLMKIFCLYYLMPFTLIEFFKILNGIFFHSLLSIFQITLIRSQPHKLNKNANDIEIILSIYRNVFFGVFWHSDKFVVRVFCLAGSNEAEKKSLEVEK